MNYARLNAITTEEVLADLEFIVPGADRPFSYGYEPAVDAPPATTEFETHRVRIHDVREAGTLSFDSNGATLLAAPTVVRNFYDDDELYGRYYPEAEELIAAVLGARRVIVFDHNVRRGNALGLRPDRYDQGRPVYHAHTDFTEASAAQRLRRELGTDASDFARQRYVQVNLWRPIRAPLRDAPLAICDSASLAHDSLRPADLRYPDRGGELYYLAYEAGQRWYYASDMGTDEAWLFKNFDSAPPSGARVAPHTAFNDLRRHRLVPPRESIELRAFVALES